LKGSEGQSTYSISKEIGLGYEGVCRWRRRWLSLYEELQIYEKGKSGEGVRDLELLKKMLSILIDRPRSGSPPKFTMSNYKQIVAIACRKPSEYNIPRRKWTHEMLAQVAVSENIVVSISPRNIGKILKKSGITTS
jgi:transposase